MSDFLWGLLAIGAIILAIVILGLLIYIAQIIGLVIGFIIVVGAIIFCVITFITQIGHQVNPNNSSSVLAAIQLLRCYF